MTLVPVVVGVAGTPTHAIVVLVEFWIKHGAVAPTIVVVPGVIDDALAVGVAQLVIPDPSVVRTNVFVPLFPGSWNVVEPAAAGTFIVTVPLLDPLKIRSARAGDARPNKMIPERIALFFMVFNILS